ncbi:unnamed protein product [Discula destructiva]
MYLPTVSPVLLLGLASLATAFDNPPEAIHVALTKRSCVERLVYFHYNDTSLGSMPSCSWNVLNLAARPMNPSAGRTLSPRTAPPDSSTCPPGQCTDGLTTNYTVRPGDTLEMIAARFNSGVCNIAAASGIADPDFIRADQVLTVPTELCDPDSDSCRTPPGVRPCVPKGENPLKRVKIAAGDTFFKLGVTFNVTADAFAAANPCVDPTKLQIGQEIKVPICPKCK